MESGRHNKNNNMNWVNTPAIFSISRAGSAQMSRLQQRDPNHAGDDYLDMIVLVIFGCLIE
jgi:hypothetical protein